MKMVSFGRGGQRLLIVCPLKMEFQQLFMAPFSMGLLFEYVDTHTHMLHGTGIFTYMNGLNLW